MAGSPPENFQLAVASLPETFTTEDAHQQAKHLKQGSVAVYLSMLSQAGVIERIGLGHYRKLDTTAPEVPIASFAKPLVSLIEKNLTAQARRLMVAWTDEDLAPYVRDAFMRHFTVIEAQPRGLEVLEHLVPFNNHVQRLRSRSQLPRELEAGRESVTFLIPMGSTKGTRPGTGGLRRPTLERLLLDVLNWEGVGIDAAQRMVSDPKFDANLALEIAGAHSQTAKMASFLTWAGTKNGRAAEWMPNFAWLHA